MEQLPDTWVAVSAPAAFQVLARQPLQSGLWLAVRRPLFVAFILACDISLIAADPFNPRLVAGLTVILGPTGFRRRLRKPAPRDLAERHGA